MMLISVAGNGCNRQITESLIEESISTDMSARDHSQDLRSRSCGSFQTMQRRTMSSQWKHTGEICKSAQCFSPRWRYFIRIASEQQSAIAIRIALQDRHPKNEAFKRVQFGHRVQFVLSMCGLQLCSPWIPFFAWPV